MKNSRIAVALALPLSLLIFLYATVEPGLIFGIVAVSLLVGFVAAFEKNAVVLAGTAVALALLPLFLFVYLDATFVEPDLVSANLVIVFVPVLVGFVSAPLAVIMGVGAWFLARRRSIGRRLPRVIAGIAIALVVLELLAVWLVV